MERFLEFCCTSVEDIVAAKKAGASRIELCENLEVGGVTPSHELIRAALDVAGEIPVNVLIRARGGDFVFTEEEVCQMVQDIGFCRQVGTNAVVIGALEADGSVDKASMKRMIDAAGNLKITFHRAFDVCDDPIKAFDDIVALGCHRLLTSGHEADAYAGRELIARLKAEHKLVILAGCGVRKSNIDLIDADEYHASIRNWNR